MLLSEWTEANVQAVAESYPQFVRVEPPLGCDAMLAWEGKICPFSDTHELGYLIDDLAHSATVLVRAGQLVHDPECSRVHTVPEFVRSVNTGTELKLRAFAFPPPRDPRAYFISPEISKLCYPAHPHLNPDSAACPYLPSDDQLPWDGRTVVKFLNFLTMWAAKHLVWLHTGGQKGGIWIGDEAPHAPHQLKRMVGRNDLCVCGSGLKFKKCCLRTIEDRCRLLGGLARR